MLTSFNTQPPEGGCICSIFRAMPVWFQHTATRRWLLLTCGHLNHCASFNTQPPEGGCKKPKNVYHLMMKFQHTATRRWLRKFFRLLTTIYLVSTHSHPKVAAYANGVPLKGLIVSTHSHPKVAAFALHAFDNAKIVSTHSHPKVAAFGFSLRKD